MTAQTQDQRWTERVTDLLVGKTIVAVAFMSDKELALNDLHDRLAA